MDSINVTISRTINLGNFENVKLEAGLSRELKSNEKATDVIEAVTDSLFKILKAKGKEAKQIMKNKSNP